MKPVSELNIQSLRSQISAVKDSIAAAAPGAPIDGLHETVSTLEKLLYREVSRLGLNRIAELPEDSSDAQLTAARLNSSVKCGDDFYLPALGSNASVLPNCFLRSSLFSAGTAAGTSVRHYRLETQGDIELRLDGPLLNSTDKRVYAALLDQYKDTPLGLDASSTTDYRSISLGELSEIVFGKGKRSANLYEVLKASLIRLGSANLYIHIPRLVDTALHSLVELERTEGGKLDGSKIKYRITSRVAALFYEYGWTAVSEDVLKQTDLAGWLATFYVSHSKPFPLHPITELKRLSGATSPNNEYRRAFKRALGKLSELDEGHSAKVSGHRYTDEGEVIVDMAAWSKSKTKKKA